jgi:hypothetical protein
MGAVAILRELWRHRVVLLLAVPLAILVGLSVGYRIMFPLKLESRRYDVGIAAATALVDTPSSQVVALGGKGLTDAATLPARAVLLANLLATSPLREDIARRAGVPPRLLIATAPPPSDGGGAAAAAQSDRLATGASVGPDDPRASVLKLGTDITLPMIAVDARAPDAATAARVANAAVAALKSYLDSVISVEGVPTQRRLVVKQLGPAQSATAHRGPSPLLGVLATIAVLGVVCAGILLIGALARDWRRMTALELLPAESAAGPPEELRAVAGEDSRHPGSRDLVA